MLLGYDRKSLKYLFGTDFYLFGRTGEIRTRDQRIKSPLLYRLSYRPKLGKQLL